MGNSLRENSEITAIKFPGKRQALHQTGRFLGLAGTSSNVFALSPAAGPAVTEGLAAETERLLSGRTRDIRFSPQMLAAYRSKTWRQRSTIARSWMIWVGLIAIVFVPVSYLMAPNSFLPAAAISGLAVPALHALGYLVWRKPRSAAVEGLSLVLLMSSVMIAYGFLAVAAGGRDYERFMSCIVYVNTIAIVVFHVEYVWSLLLMVSSTAIFLGFEIFNPAIDLKEAIGTSVFYAMAIFAVTNARKTQLILSQKTFLMSLRDQYRRDQLEILATRDPLTGLANRRSAADLIQRVWTDRRIAREAIAFVMADIDSFKRLNDTAGHAAGDHCIQRVAATIAQTVRAEHDLVFRYGGEEFLIVLTRTSPDVAFEVTERIRGAVEALAIVNPGIQKADGSHGVVTISLGVALGREDATPEQVAIWADAALYEAKRSGRNKVFMSIAAAGAFAEANRPQGQAAPAQPPMAIPRRIA